MFSEAIVISFRSSVVYLEDFTTSSLPCLCLISLFLLLTCVYLIHTERCLLYFLGADFGSVKSWTAPVLASEPALSLPIVLLYAVLSDFFRHSHVSLELIMCLWRTFRNPWLSIHINIELVSVNRKNLSLHEELDILKKYNDDLPKMSQCNSAVQLKISLALRRKILKHPKASR